MTTLYVVTLALYERTDFEPEVFVARTQEDAEAAALRFVQSELFPDAEVLPATLEEAQGDGWEFSFAVTQTPLL